MAPLVWAVAFLVLAVPALYYSMARSLQAQLPTLRNQRICLLIAHPDDEAMFFAPTILALTQPDKGNHVKILCLSRGNAEGLGDTRKREMVKSALILGLQREDDVAVYDSPDFPDSMTTTWAADKIAALLDAVFVPKSPNGKAPGSRNASPPARPTVDVLITFDDKGVSSHPNHVSLYHGARTFIGGLGRLAGDGQSTVAMYTLSSVSIWRKYAGVVDALATYVMQWLGGDNRGADHDAEKPESLVFLSDTSRVRSAWRAMTEAHVSQMIWFRYGWISLSRYMVVNDLRREDGSARQGRKNE